MLDFLKKVLGSGNEVQLKKLNKPVEAVMALEEEYRALTDEALQAKTEAFRQRLQNGETEDDILPEALPPSGKPRTGCWACAPSGYRCWAALCCTRAASRR